MENSVKKLLVTALLTLLPISAAMADPYRHHRSHRHNWVVPAIIGGTVTYMLTRPAPAVPYQQPYVYNVPPAPFGYHYRQVIDPSCNCYRLALLPN